MHRFNLQRPWPGRHRAVWFSALLAIFLVTGGYQAFRASQRAYAAAASSVRWGPVIGDLKPTSVTIAWRTRGRTPGKLWINGRELTAKAVGDIHRVSVSGLQPGREYTYRIATDNAAQSGREFRFRTPPASLDSFRFIAYGDCRSRRADHQAVIDSMQGFGPAFILNTGDLVADGRVEEQWDDFFAVVSPVTARTLFLPTLGNHERNARLYYDFWPLPRGGGERSRQWYRYVYGSLSIIALDSNRVADPAQLKWMRETLSRARRESTWVICFFHHPPYSSTHRNGTESVRKYWVPLFEEYGVDLCFSGHDHCYERSEKSGITYVTTGGGGAPRYPVHKTRNPFGKKAESTLHHCRVEVSPSSMVIHAVRPDGSTVDRFVLQRREKGRREAR